MKQQFEDLKTLIKSCSNNDYDTAILWDNKIGFYQLPSDDVLKYKNMIAFISKSKWHPVNMNEDLFPIKYGNLSGTYYNKNSTKIMQNLAVEMFQHLIDMKNVSIFYDSQGDFHHLNFEANGKFVDVKYYKVFSTKVNGKDVWPGCPIYKQQELHYRISEEVSK